MTIARLRAVTRFLEAVAEGDGQTDRQLLDRFVRHRDEAAFAHLVRRHGPMVLSVSRRLLGHEQDAEDAFQAAFLVLARKAGSIRQQESVGGWLYRVAYRLALRARSSPRRRHERLTDPAALPALAGAEAPGDAPPPALDEVQHLPEPYRTALVLCYVEGRTQAEAARLLVTTADAVNNRLRRGRELLRRRLARHGLLLSANLGGVLSADAAVSSALARLTARAALRFAVNPAACGASAPSVILAQGALRAMLFVRFKLLSLFAVALALLGVAALALPLPALGDDGPAPARDKGPAVAAPDRPAPPGQGKALKRRACILLWMSGGPSQFETFDLKPGAPTGGPFRAIATTARGVQISEHLPQLAKRMNRVAVIRSLTHREGDHGRGTYLMHTGYSYDGVTNYPELGCVLAKELGGPRPALPRFVSVMPTLLRQAPGQDAGFLGPQYSAVLVRQADKDGTPRLPPAEAFDGQAKGQGERMRKAVARAFDLSAERPALRDAYGRNPFGQGCLLARRLIEAGTPVVEVALGGWDTHANAFPAEERLSARLDAAWASLLKDLEDRGLLDQVLVVWMGEFGRTPRINANRGRDHWPLSFSVALAGRGIKGGQAIGATNADGTAVAQRPVTPAELLATVYQALGVPPTREYVSNTGRRVPLVPPGTQAVAEARR